VNCKIAASADAEATTFSLFFFGRGIEEISPKSKTTASFKDCLKKKLNKITVALADFFRINIWEDALYAVESASSYLLRQRWEWRDRILSFTVSRWDRFTILFRRIYGNQIECCIISLVNPS